MRVILNREVKGIVIGAVLLKAGEIPVFKCGALIIAICFKFFAASLFEPLIIIAYLFRRLNISVLDQFHIGILIELDVLVFDEVKSSGEIQILVIRIPYETKCFGRARVYAKLADILLVV